MELPSRKRLVDLRRDFHQYPEPSWGEFRTTARIVEELEQIGIDELYIGPEVLDVDSRLGVPSDQDLANWYERAQSETDQTDILEQIKGGKTGVVAVVKSGEGPTVGLRVDIDALPITESDDEEHYPAAEGFRSNHEGLMHACGHDSHITFGLGTLETVVNSDFNGTLKVFFQPAEEVAGGGKPMANTDHIDDVDYFLGVHVGLGRSTGEIVAGIDKALAVNQFELTFEGESAHAGIAPNEGRNAVQALVTSIENMYGISRHEGGDTRLNVGELHSENASNIIADRATATAEVRGETTELMEYMWERSLDVLEHGAAMHNCSVDIETTGQAPREDSDEELVDLVATVGTQIEGVTSIIRRADLGGSEDVTHLMRAVKNRGEPLLL